MSSRKSRAPGRRRARLLGSSCLLATLLAFGTANADDESDWRPPPLKPPPPGALAEAVDWARTHALPLETLEPGSDTADLQPLKAMIGDARIIGFGEGMHDTHEYLAFRNRLFAFLVEEMGVTAIGLESGATEALAADDYVLGRSEANAAAFVSVFSWSKDGVQENRQLLDWMRSYNQRPTTKRALRVYGLDLTGGRSGEFTESRLALEAMLAYVARVDAALARRLHAVIDPLAAKFNSKQYRSLSPASRNALSGAISDAVGAFEREHIDWVQATSSFDYHRAYQQAIVSQQLDMGMRNTTAANPQSQRDSSMARNAVWALEQQGAGGKLMVFSYIGHIRKGRTNTDSSSLGLYLHELVGDQYVVIGSLFNQGAVGTVGIEEWPMPLSAPSTLNAALRAGAARDLFYFDTRQFPTQGPLADWVDRGEPLRHDYFEGRPRSSFDVLLYVDTIRPANALK